MEKYSTNNLLKILLVLVLYGWNVWANAQSTCPPDYSIRDVRCKGIITSQCVPDNYNCDKCWTVANPPCAGNTFGGEGFYDSYDKALAAAEKGKKENNSCPWYNDQEYTIYIDDTKFCNDYKKDKDVKVTSVDGKLIGEVPEDPSFKKKYDESLIRTRKLLNDPSKVKDSSQIIKGVHNIDQMGVRAENSIPKVESMAITADKTDSVRVTPNSHKK